MVFYHMYKYLRPVTIIILVGTIFCNLRVLILVDCLQNSFSEIWIDMSLQTENHQHEY